MDVVVYVGRRVGENVGAALGVADVGLLLGDCVTGALVGL